MANVGFKRGSQSNLNTLINHVQSGDFGYSYSDGAFYLTTDTDRLYYAQSSTELVELNKSIHIINSVSDLPSSTTSTQTAIKGNEVEVGQFYYVKSGADSTSGNILAVCSAINGTTITWTQVNPDTDTDTKYIFTGAAATSSSITNGASVATTFTVQPQNKTGTDIGTSQTVSSTFSIVGDNQQIEVQQNNGTISLSGKVEVGTTASANNNVLTLSTTGIGSSNDSITITPQAVGNNSYIQFSGSDNEITITGGGVSGVSASNGTITVTNAAGPSATATDIGYKIGDTLYGIGAEVPLPVYTTQQIDNLLKGLNAVTYCGTIDATTANSINWGNLHNGDAYLIDGDGDFATVRIKVNNEYTIDTVNCKIGGLLIACGPETNGTIDTTVEDSYYWTYVPSGSEVDTTYTLGISAIENINNAFNINLIGTTGSGSAIELVGSNLIGLEYSQDNENNKILTIAHTAPTGAGSSISLGNDTQNTTTIDVITGINIDNYGHIRSAVKHNIATTDTLYKMKDSRVSGTAQGIIDWQTVEGGSIGTLSSTSLTINSTTGNNNIPAFTIDLTWETF